MASQSSRAPVPAKADKGLSLTLPRFQGQGPLPTSGGKAEKQSGDLREGGWESNTQIDAWRLVSSLGTGGAVWR